MTMTLGQVRDEMVSMTSTKAMEFYLQGRWRDAIDAHIVGMGKPVAWQQKRRPSDYPDEWRECSKEVFDMISRTTDSPWVARELFASPPIDLAAVREVIADLRTAWRDESIDDIADKLEAAMPKEAR